MSYRYHYSFLPKEQKGFSTDFLRKSSLFFSPNLPPLTKLEEQLSRLRQQEQQRSGNLLADPSGA